MTEENRDSSVPEADRGGEPRARLLLAGDLYPGGRPEAMLTASRGDSPWQSLSGTWSAYDLRVANLECPLTHRRAPIPKTGPHLRAAPETAAGLRRGGLDVVSLANNHIMDHGIAGLRDTFAACHQAGLATVGAGLTQEEAEQPLVVTVGTLRLAIVATAEGEFAAARGGRAGATPLDPVETGHRVRACREMADFVLVLYHGGHEYYPLPSPQMVAWCRHLVECGADAVMCHHTHVASGTEYHRGVPIVYGMGNFLFDRSRGPKAWYHGYLVGLDVAPHAVRRLRLIPYSQCRPDAGVRALEGAESEAFLAEIDKLSAVIADPSQLMREWTRYLDLRRADYLATCFGLNRVERKLLKRGWLPRWWLSGGRVRKMYNMLACASHRELLLGELEREVFGKGEGSC